MVKENTKPIPTDEVNPEALEELSNGKGADENE